MSQHTTQNKFVRVIRLFGDALTGKQNDYTTGSLRKAIFLLAIPMIIEMGMESVFALVDLFFVSKLGKHAVSTVGLTESVLTLVYSIAVGMSMAATAMVARRIGEKDKEGAAVAAIQSMWVGIGITILLSMAGVVFAEDILRIMGAEAETIQMGVPYTRIMMGSSLVIMLLFLINGIFRGAGDASIAMRSLIIANGCNIVLCPILINGMGPIPAFGITGAAMATAIGRSIGVVYQLYHLFNGKSIIRLTKASIKAEWEIIKSIFKIAWPATV
ncbi:MAG: MATE family efflux transporter, partial [Chitinophagaceae bacterium]